MARHCEVLITLLFLLAGSLYAEAPRIALEPLASGLADPVFLTNAHDGTNRRFIVEQAGRIRVLQPGASSSTLFLDITARVLFGGERGLLGLAFHPQFPANRRFFVNYTRRPDGATVVAEYTASAGNPNIADSNEKILFTVPQPYENHNGGMVEFGPDGYLYVGMGDGGSANDPGNRAQNLNELLGKMLRINVDVPNSRPEIFAYGFRNPWRFSFDRMTGQLYAADVGQNAREEIDIVTMGGNYGWRVWEGTQCTNLDPPRCSAPGFIPPIAEYVNTAPNGRCAIIGGYIYRGTQASLPYGAYVYGDLCTGEIFMLKDGVQTVLLDTTLQISSFGEDEAGEVYVLNLGGSIFRITNPDATMASSRSFAVTSTSPFVASTAGSASALVTGYARIQADPGNSSPSGIAVIGYRPRGILVSEAAIALSPLILSGRTFAEIDGRVSTGIAFANPNNQAVTVSFFFTDASGNNVGEGTAVIPANRQIAAFLSETPFNGPASFFGTFTFSSLLAVSAVALRGFTNERSEFLFTTLPIVQVGGTAAATTVIPHFSDGGGWSTGVVLVNSSDSAINGGIQFADRSGQVIRTSSYSIAARSSTRIETAGTGTNVQTGSVRITPGVNAFSIFAYKANGVTVTQAGVPAPAPATAFQNYVESRGVVRSGLAIANPSASAVTVNLDLSGITAAISVPANGQRSFFLNEISEFAGLPPSFAGVLRIAAPSPIAVTSLRGRTNERGEFLITMTPPADESAATSTSELWFPHFADGAGYDTQFILFGRPASGTMVFFSQAGEPANLPFQ